MGFDKGCFRDKRIADSGIRIADFGFWIQGHCWEGEDKVKVEVKVEVEAEGRK